MMDNNATTLAERVGNAVSFKQFLSGCGDACIPRIQRAYAQGRKEESLIRENFLDDLFDALRNGRVLELNFVYGSRRDGRFEILDGQQRLTTLFLLHWYCANAELDGIPAELGNLKYETRPTSGDFLQDLVRGKIDFSGRLPSVAIRNAKWFSHAYGCDPTILSVLGMLDAIHEHYQAAKAETESSFSLYGKLDLIRFYELPLEGYSRTEELYVKMNARGLPLTPFENFKADLSDWLRRRDDGQFSSPVDFGGREMEWSERFLSKIDTTWTDYLWRNGGNGDFKSDDAELSARLFRVFIRFLMYRRLTCSDESAEALENDDAVKFLDDGGKGAESQTDVYLGFRRYEDVLEKDPDALRGIERILDALIRAAVPFESLDKLLVNPHDDGGWSWVGEKKKFQRTHAIACSAAMAFLEKAGTFDEVEFKQWMRVVWNAIQNTNIDGIKPQIRLTKSLVRFARTPGLTDDVYGTLAGLKGENLPRALEEEIRKAGMIVNGADGRDVWEREIVAAERAPFFAGMIGFYIQDDLTLEQFCHRREMACKLFDENGIAPAYRDHHCLLRAMLAQIPTWKNGIEDRFLSENVKTNDAYLKNFLASSAPVQAFFKRIVDLPTELEMKTAVFNAFETIPTFDAGDVNESSASGIKRLYERLVGDEKVLDWAADIENEKGKSPVVELRYGHYMLNVPYCWSARLVLDVEREEMVQRLVEEKGFEISAPEQRKSLAKYGYFTDYNVELTRPAEEGLIKVTFKMDHVFEIARSGHDPSSGTYGTMETFPAVSAAIEAAIGNRLNGSDWASRLQQQPQFSDHCSWDRLPVDGVSLSQSSPVFRGKTMTLNEFLNSTDLPPVSEWQQRGVALDNAKSISEQCAFLRKHLKYYCAEHKIDTNMEIKELKRTKVPGFGHLGEMLVLANGTTYAAVDGALRVLTENPSAGDASSSKNS